MLSKYPSTTCVMVTIVIHEGEPHHHAFRKRQTEVNLPTGPSAFLKPHALCFHASFAPAQQSSHYFRFTIISIGRATSAKHPCTQMQANKKVKRTTIYVC